MKWNARLRWQRVVDRAVRGLSALLDGVVDLVVLAVVESELLALGGDSHRDRAVGDPKIVAVIIHATFAALNVSSGSQKYVSGSCLLNSISNSITFLISSFSILFTITTFYSFDCFV